MLTCTLLQPVFTNGSLPCNALTELQVAAMGNCLGTPQETGGVGGPAAASHPGMPAKLPSKPGTPAAKPGTPGSAVHVQAGGSGAQVAPAPTPAGPPRPDAAKMHQMRKRIAVAAEAISSAADIEIPVIPKTDYAERLIGGKEQREVLAGVWSEQAVWRGRHAASSCPGCQLCVRDKLASTVINRHAHGLPIMCPSRRFHSSTAQPRPSRAACCLSSCRCPPSRRVAVLLLLPCLPHV